MKDGNSFCPCNELIYIWYCVAGSLSLQSLSDRNLIEIASVTSSSAQQTTGVTTRRKARFAKQYISLNYDNANIITLSYF